MSLFPSPRTDPPLSFTGPARPGLARLGQAWLGPACSSPVWPRPDQAGSGRTGYISVYININIIYIYIYIGVLGLGAFARILVSGRSRDPKIQPESMLKDGASCYMAKPQQSPAGRPAQNLNNRRPGGRRRTSTTPADRPVQMGGVRGER